MKIIQVHNRTHSLGYPKRIYQFRLLEGEDTYINNQMIAGYSDLLHEIIFKEGIE